VIQSQEELIREGGFLFRKLFGDVAEAPLLPLYVAAHEALNLQVDPRFRRLLTVIIDHNLDALSIEYVLRLRVGENLLSTKIAILCYLAESSNTHWRRFWSESANVTACLFIIVRIFFEIPFRYLKGNILVRRYDFA